MMGEKRACVHCGDEFEIIAKPRGRQRIFCSKYCRGRAYYEANREDSIARSRKYREKHGERRREMARVRHLLNMYNMTAEDYDTLLAEQGGVCAVCQSPDSGNRPWQVDHDHKCCDSRSSCGKCIRGLLCASCNRGIGWLKDDPDTLRRAADYVEAHRPGLISMARGA